MSGKDWIKALNRIESRPELPVTFGGGEPFLHQDFIYIINNLRPDLNIDILTNLYYEKALEAFLKEVSPKKLKRDSPYAPIRVSYHPEQMDPAKLIENTKKFKKAGFDLCVYTVQHPAPGQQEARTQMQFRCLDAGIEFRIKDFLGKYRGELYGDYSKYPDSIHKKNTKTCSCRTSELLISTNLDVYRCHRDLYLRENPIGTLLSEFQIQDIFRTCNKYGNCNPCDVKVKTDYKQQLGHTSVEIKNIK